jgi:hypothetical protein
MATRASLRTLLERQREAPRVTAHFDLSVRLTRASSLELRAPACPFSWIARHDSAECNVGPLRDSLVAFGAFRLRSSTPSVHNCPSRPGICWALAAARRVSWLSRFPRSRISQLERIPCEPSASKWRSQRPFRRRRFGRRGDGDGREADEPRRACGVHSESLSHLPFRCHGVSSVMAGEFLALPSTDACLSIAAGGSVFGGPPGKANRDVVERE